MSYDFKYADLLDDVFKLVFGRESTKDVMIEFLNQVIPDRKIVDLEFIDKEMLTDDVSLDKTCKYTELSIEEIEALKA